MKPAHVLSTGEIPVVVFWLFLHVYPVCNISRTTTKCVGAEGRIFKFVKCGTEQSGIDCVKITFSPPTFEKYGEDNKFSSFAQSSVSDHQISQPRLLKNVNKPFILLEEDRSVIPIFELNRRLGNVFAQFRYRYFFEKEFTVKGFLNGAIQAALLCANYIRHGDWGNLRRIMIDEAVSELQTRFDPFNTEDFERLKFSLDDVIYSVIDSSYTCGKVQPKISGLRSFFPAKHRAFYSQVIIYIKKSNIDESKSIERLLRISPPRSLLICNITLSRILSPLGMWKVTRINFFDYP
ncbi:Hemolymph clottable protein [Dirofilaria immitis]